MQLLTRRAVLGYVRANHPELHECGVRAVVRTKGIGSIVAAVILCKQQKP
jgi:hypothetical protein